MSKYGTECTRRYAAARAAEETFGTADRAGWAEKGNRKANNHLIMVKRTDAVTLARDAAVSAYEAYLNFLTAIVFAGYMEQIAVRHKEECAVCHICNKTILPKSDGACPWCEAMKEAREQAHELFQIGQGSVK